MDFFREADMMAPLYPTCPALQPSSLHAFAEAFERAGRTVPALAGERTALDLVRTRTDTYLESLADARESGVPDVFVFEPAGASFRISETRLIAERAFALSGADARAYFFVCRAELLTVDASNSLLKILEDVPAGICFVLVSEYPDRMLPTVRSRCISLDSTDRMASVDLDADIVRRIDAYLAGSRAALLVHVANTPYERPEALALLSAIVARMGSAGRLDAELARRIGRGIEDLSGTTVSPRNILDSVFLV
jgi:hypothetical protein